MHGMDLNTLEKVIRIGYDFQTKQALVRKVAEEEGGLFCLAEYTKHTNWCDTPQILLARYIIFGDVSWACDCCGEARMEQASDRAFAASFEF